jgi:heme exporter protein C
VTATTEQLSDRAGQASASSPVRRWQGVTGTPFTRGLGITTLIALAWVAVLGLAITPEDRVQHEAVRIMYVHVPSAIIAYLAFSLTAFASAMYLFRRAHSLAWDRVAGASGEVGVLFMALTLVTGSLWGRISWGQYWEWDARLTTTAFMFVTYIGYLAVRRLGGSHHARARRSGVLALLAVLEIPLVHFSVEWWRSLHQEATIGRLGDVKIDGLMRFSLYFSLTAFLLAYTWLVMHRQRLMYLEDEFEEHDLDIALAERRAEAVSGRG